MMNHVRLSISIVGVLFSFFMISQPLFAQSMLQIPPEALEAYHQGVFYGKAGKYIEAVMELNHAIEAYPDYADAYNALGVVYQRQQQAQDAIGSYLRAIESNPQHAKARTNLALVYKDQADYEHAIQQLEEALKADPAYAAAQKLLPEVRKLFEEQQAATEAAAQAEAAARAAQQKPPVKEITVSAVPPSKPTAAPKPAPTPSPKSGFEQGTDHARKGELDAGIEAYKQALLQLPCSSEGLTLLGMTYREKFRVTQQLAWQQEEVLSFQKAIQCDPTYIPAILALAETMYAQKDYVNAVRYFQYVLQFEPNHPAREQIEKFLGRQ